MRDRLSILGYSGPMNKLPLAKRAQILGLLVEGNSLRATSRLADCSINTVTKLLVDVGTACAEYQDKTLRNLPCKRVQCDEIWAFVYAKAKNAPAEMRAAGEAGDVWTWTAIDADTKLIASWMVGPRTVESAHAFIADLAARLANRVQLTTDGHKPYLNAVEGSFGGDIDYAVLMKLYRESHGSSPERRYSAGECCGTIKGTVCGNPDDKHVSTSFVERPTISVESIRRCVSHLRWRPACQITSGRWRILRILRPPSEQMKTLTVIFVSLFLPGCYQAVGTIDGGMYKINTVTGAVTWCKRGPRMGTDNLPITCYDQAGDALP
jgi:hypothetical protein